MIGLIYNLFLHPHCRDHNDFQLRLEELEIKNKKLIEDNSKLKHEVNKKILVKIDFCKTCYKGNK